MANSKYKPLIFISGLLVAALAGIYLYQSKFKKKLPVSDKPSDADIVPATMQTPIKSPKAPTIPANPPLRNIPPEAVRPNTGFAPPIPKGPVSVAVKTPKIGANLYVLPTGANAYKLPAASQANIYKYFPKNAFVGTFLAKTGSFSKILIEGKKSDPVFNIPLTANITVFIPSKDLYEK
jgi:hypothetical protein